MKANVGKILVSMALGALVYASALTAQTSTLPGDDDDVSNPGLPTDPSFPGWDRHGNNRAVAFGSVLLKDFGSDYDRWQAIEAHSWCDWPFPIPGDEEDPVPFPGNGSGSGSGGSSGGTTTPDCPNTWDVMVVTDYRLEVCPDGRAYIARSGDGVIVTDRHTGEFYAWSEVYGCESGNSSGGVDQAMNKTRPIDRKLLKRIMK